MKRHEQTCSHDSPKTAIINGKECIRTRIGIRKNRNGMSPIYGYVAIEEAKKIEPAPLKLGAERTAERLAAYEETKNDIANLIGWFECELEKKTAKGWGEIGNLRKVRNDLLETLAFLSNSQVEHLRVAMEDAR